MGERSTPMTSVEGCASAKSRALRYWLADVLYRRLPYTELTKCLFRTQHPELYGSFPRQSAPNIVGCREGPSTYDGLCQAGHFAGHRLGPWSSSNMINDCFVDVILARFTSNRSPHHETYGKCVPIPRGVEECSRQAKWCPSYFCERKSLSVCGPLQIC